MFNNFTPKETSDNLGDLMPKQELEIITSRDSTKKGALIIYELEYPFTEKIGLYRLILKILDHNPSSSQKEVVYQFSQ